MLVISYKVKQVCRNLCTAHWYQSFKCGHQSMLKSKISHTLGIFNLSTVPTSQGALLSMIGASTTCPEMSMMSSRANQVFFCWYQFDINQTKKQIPNVLVDVLSFMMETCTTIIRILKYCLFFSFYTQVKIRILNKKDF